MKNNDTHFDKEEVARRQGIADKMTTPQELIIDLIRTQLSREPEKLVRLLEGEVSETYEFVANKDEFVIRVSHEKNRSFDMEVWAIEQANNVGVPTAEVLKNGSFEVHGRTRHYIIQRKLHGRSFDKLLWIDGIDQERSKAITMLAGQLLSRLHLIKVDGYGHLVKPGVGSFKTGEEWVVQATKKRSLFQRMFKDQELLRDCDLDDVFSILKENGKHLQEQASLIHEDFAPKHIFVNPNNSIKGVIDFGDASGGDVARDICDWTFWFEESAPTKWIIQGYEDHSNLGDNFDKRFRVTLLHFSLWTLYYYVHQSPYPKHAAMAARWIKQATDSDLSNYLG